MKLSVDDFLALPDDCREEGRAWLAQVLGGPNVHSQGIECTDDGRWRIDVVVCDTDGRVVLNEQGDDALLANFVTTVEPPRCVQDAMT